jgi:hypothetical protein
MQMCLVGSRNFNTFGSHGADHFVKFAHYENLEQCVAHLKEKEGCQIVGIEITEGALPVHHHPFKGEAAGPEQALHALRMDSRKRGGGLWGRGALWAWALTSFASFALHFLGSCVAGPTAFMLGNEGQGMSPKQMSLCDSFVYIPQHGEGTASLNVAVACSIVLHHFAVWASYPEREREGHKFVVAARQQRTTARGVAGDPEKVRRARQQRTEGSEGSDEEGAAGGLDWD